MATEEQQQHPLKSDLQQFCEHIFYELYRNEQRQRHEDPKEGDHVWFYCDKCLITVKKVLSDQSDKL